MALAAAQLRAGAAANPPAAQQQQEEVDDKELNFLILHYLRNGPCPEAARAMQAELESNSLLPERLDFEGEAHPGAYSELVSRHGLEPSHLRNLLGQLVNASQRRTHQQGPNLGAQLKPSLLSIGGTAARRNLEERKQTQKQSDAPSIVSLLNRETGSRQSSALLRRTVPSQLVVPKLTYMRTLRGHKMPVYCIVWDRTGTRFVTGSDDRLVKIWSAVSGMLLSTCRGHDGEVTDFAVSSCNGFVASSSNDSSVRVWHLTGPKTGNPQCVLSGHSGPVSYVDFSPTVSNAVISCSFDGTCRIWNILDPSAPAVVLHPVPLAFGASRRTAAAQLEGSVQPSCYWSGSRAADARAEHEQQLMTARAAAEELRGGATGLSGGADGAIPSPLTLLCCSFSPCGSYVVAGGNDCSSYLWHWNTSTSASAGSSSSAERTAFPGLPLPTEVLQLSGHRNDISLVCFNHSSSAVASASKDGHVRVWKKTKFRSGRPNRFEPWMCLKCDILQQQTTTGRGPRRRTTVPEVNQVTWTSDDQHVIAALSDNTIRVWDASGKHQAKGGSDSADIGRVKYILTAHKEQVHVVSAHPTCPHTLMSAGYDGQVIIWNLQTGRPIQTFGTADRGGIHSDPIQVLDGHFSPDGCSVVVSDVAGQTTLYSSGNRCSLAMAQYDQFFASDYAVLLRDASNNVLDADSQLPPHLLPPQQLVDITGSAYPQSYQVAFRVGAFRGALASGSLGQILGGGTQPGDLSWMLTVTAPPVIMAAYWHASSMGLNDRVIERRVQEAESRLAAYHQAATFQQAGLQVLSTGATVGVPQVVRVSPQVATVPGPSQPGARRQPQAGQQALVTSPQQQGRRVRRAAVMQDEEEEEEDAEWQAEGMESDREADSDVQGLVTSSDDDEDYGTLSRGRTRRGGRQRATGRGDQETTRSGRQSRRPLHPDEIEGDSIDHLSGEEARAAARRRLRSNKRARDESEDGNERKRKKKKKSKKRKQQAQDDVEEDMLQPRLLDAYEWLLPTEPTVPSSEYVPQLGDSVVYLKDNHVRFLEGKNDKLTQPPWSQMRVARSLLRQAEPCRVVSLEYYIVNGTYQTGAKLRLEFTEPECKVRGRHFNVELLHDDDQSQDYIIPEERFKASTQDWHPGSTFQMYYKDEGLWRGKVLQDLGMEAARSNPVTYNPDLLPFDGVELYERFQVCWFNSSGSAAGSSSSRGSFNMDYLEPVSPWEMLPDGLSEDELIAREVPRLAAPKQLQMLAALQEAKQDPLYGAFLEVPEWNANFGGSFYNASIALPISLTEIEARLESGWYRTPEGLRGDLELLTKNALEFNNTSSEIALAATQLTAGLLEVLQAEPPAVPALPPAEEQAQPPLGRGMRRGGVAASRAREPVLLPTLAPRPPSAATSQQAPIPRIRIVQGTRSRRSRPSRYAEGHPTETHA